jgi:uncharacterized protein (DUF2147 family)
MRAYPLSLAFAIWSGAAASAPPSIQGLWRTDDHKALVRIAPCARLMCGTIARMLDRGPNVPKTDVNNPDPHLKSRPIVGMAILSGFQGAGGSWKGGRAYDPKSGKSYRSTLELQPDGSLKVSGCILFICESRRWQRPR